jgi:hypothetical protein
MTDSLAAALAELQKDLPRVVKDKTATVTSQRTGKTHKYSYAGLPDIADAIMPRLSAQGLSFSCRPTLHPEFGFVLAYQLLHTSGEERSGFYPLNAEDSPQARGSAITYARRYCLCAITGVAADEDDDAQAAEHARADGLPVNKDGSLSRSRTTDAQKDAAGVMTKAQQDEHTELRKGTGTEDNLPKASPRQQTVLTTEPDDPFYGIPAEPDTTPPEDRHGTATADQIRDVNIRLSNHGLTKKAERLAYLTEQTGHEIYSSADLSVSEALKVLRELPQRSKAVAP